jgi:hypothetical protein
MSASNTKIEIKIMSKIMIKKKIRCRHSLTTDTRFQ